MAKQWFCFVACAILASGLPARAEDWPAYGRDRTRNPVSPERNAPTDWDVAEGRNVKWKQALGSCTFGSPVVAGGLVWVCTNNAAPRDDRFKKDMGCLMCFDERDGRFLWQHLTPRIGKRGIDPSESSVGSTPLVEGDRLWFITNRWEVVCIDIGPLRRRTGEAREVWKLDMPRDLGIRPYATVMTPSMRCAIGPSYGGRIYVTTGNGIGAPGFGDPNVPAPQAPSLVCLDKETGKVVWSDNSPGEGLFDGQWGSPLVAEVNGRAQVIAAQGDGWVRSFDAATGELIWIFDACPKDAVEWLGRRNTVIAPPVLYLGRVYLVQGRDREHAEGPGLLWCIDPTKTGDISAELDNGPAAPGGADAAGAGRRRKGRPNPNSGVVWKFDEVAGGGKGPGKVPEKDNMHRTLASVAAAEGLVVAADSRGFVHCLDAATGRRYWAHDLDFDCEATPLIADGKVYVAADDGRVQILALAREEKLLAEHDLGGRIYCAPVLANGVLYVATADTLYAIEQRGPAAASAPAPAAGGRAKVDAIFVTTPQDVVERMLELAGVTKEDVVYDLGCGDGRIVVTAAKKYGCRAVGVDVDAQCVRTSRENVAKAGVGGLVEVAQKDMFDVDLGGATVVTLYVGREANRRLLQQLQKLKPASRIISHEFEIEGCEPEKVVEIVSGRDDATHRLYLWTAPLKVREDGLRR